MLILNRLGFCSLVIALCLVLNGGWPTPASALPGDPEGMMGTIPGTEMSKDEFRARAYAQLAAVALNAHAFLLVEGEFAPSYYELYNSPAWNLEISNIFSGRTVDAIEFNPIPTEMTSEPVIGLPMFDTPDTAGGVEAPDIVRMHNSGQLQNPGALDLSKLSDAALQQGVQTNSRRVNPEAISPKDPGSIYYYTKDGLLQLVMFAPGGETYCEFVSEVPNRSWLDALTIKSTGGLSFPEDMFANEVLYYTERILPRHFNMVRFMSDSQPLNESELKRSGAQERIELAAELGITLYNPYRKRAAKVVETPALGEFLVEQGAAPLPLLMTIKNGTAGSFVSLTAAERGTPPGKVAPDSTKLPVKPGKPRTAPPMGGRKG